MEEPNMQDSHLDHNLNTMPDTGSATAGIWPHLLTPAVFILFYTLPPFPGRRLLLAATVAPLAWLCLFAPPPADGGLASLLRFAMAAMWMHYLGWLSRMVFHDPEHQFWRAGKPPHEAETMGFGWAKLRWACSLLFSWRGVGWNIEILGLPPSPRRREPRGRARFVLSELGAAALYYLAVDVATMLLQRWHFQTGAESIVQLGWPRRVALTMAIGLCIWWYTELQYAVWSAFLVATRLSKEEVCCLPRKVVCVVTDKYA